MSIEVDALKQFFAAINRNDIQAAAEHFDPQVLRVEPEGFPMAGTHRGSEVVREHLRAGRGSWAEGTCEPEKFLVNANKVVVYLHAWVRMRGAADWTGGRFADGFAFRDGKIIEYRTFGQRADALKWAGIEGEAAE